MDKYIYQYLENNNINSIADVKKAQWPHFTRIELSKNVVTKVEIN